MKKVYLSFALSLLFVTSFSQAKFLDNTFGNNGYAVTNFGSSSVLYSIAVQSDNKVVAAGTTNENFAVSRYNPDGSADNSFGTKGQVVTDLGNSEYAGAVVLQPDGKIVVAGYTQTGTYPDIQSNMAIMRYNTDGSLDNSFGTGGKVITGDKKQTYVYAMALQKDGKIVITGSTSYNGSETEILLVRYKTDGTPDSLFGRNGIVTSRFDAENEAYAIALQPNGYILVAGYTYDGVSNTTNSALVRYKKNGSLDSTFSTNGLATDYRGVASSLALQADGKILVGGRRYNDDYNFYGYLLRKNPDGSADNSYILAAGDNSDSKVYSLALQPDGKAVVSVSRKGNNLNMVLGVLRLTTQGKTDTTFGNNGFVAFSNENILFNYPPANPLALQADGKILLGATFYSSFAVARIRSQDAVSIANHQQQNKLTIRAYPNPVFSNLIVDGLNKNLPAVMTITDVSGNVMMTYKMAAGTTSIDIARLTPGRYIAVFTQDNMMGSLKFIKQ